MNQQLYEFLDCEEQIPVQSCFVVKDDRRIYEPIISLHSYVKQAEEKVQKIRSELPEYDRLYVYWEIVSL